jgi:hypothetical protein
MPKETRPIRFTPIVSSASEIHRAAPQYLYQHAPTVNPRLDKIRMVASNQRIPLIYINAQYSYTNEKTLEKLRAGDLSANLTVIAIGVVVYVICQLLGVYAFGIIAQWNGPTISPGFAPTTSYSSTEIALVLTQVQEFNDMSLMFNKPKAKFNFVMTRDEDLNLIDGT